MSKSPVRKRIRLDPSASPSPRSERDFKEPSDRQGTAKASSASLDIEDEDHCVICLQHIRDRTLLPCAHDRMCFECILVWTAQSRRCPLCNAPIGPYLIHNIRSRYDYQKRYLPPLQTSPPHVAAPLPLLPSSNGARTRGRTGSHRWGPRSRRSASRERLEMEDELELAVQRRKWVYRHGLYAKHVASNPYTRYRPAPTPAQIAASPDTISRATIFIRRELRVWVNLDVEFLTTFILSLMKSLDLRSESAVKLLAEFLDMDTPYHVGAPSESTGRFSNAEHFAHELYCYLRSPFRELAAYDSSVQYDIPEHIPSAPTRPSPPRSEIHSPRAGILTPRRRRNSSPSPLRYSSRDMGLQSQTLKYSNSPEDHSRYDNPHPSKSKDRGPSPRVSPTGITTNTGEGDGSHGDRKGKGKEIVRSRPDRIIQRQDDGRPRREARYPESRPQNRSPEITSAATRHHDTRMAREPQSCRSPADALSSSPRPAKVTLGDSRGLSSVTSSSESPARTNPRPQGVPARVPHQDAGLSGNQQPEADHAASTTKSETTWGISIKGQAKLLKQTRNSSRQRHNPGGRQGSRGRGDGLEDKSSQDGTTNMGALHTPSDTDISKRDCPAKDPPAIDANGTCETQNGTSLDEISVVLPGDHTSTADDLSQSSLVNLRSVPQIMARTRAKIAKLRGQSSLDGVVSASDAGDGVKEETPANLSLRARLLERLEEEKRQASILQSDPQDWASFSLSEIDGDGLTSHEVEVRKSAGEEDLGRVVSTESLQAETKLRAQALLHIRLAAEKKTLEEGGASREEALRAKLLSRRA